MTPIDWILVDITGPAGTGKSRSLGAAIEVMRSLPTTAAQPTIRGPQSDFPALPIFGFELNSGQQRAVDAIVRAGGKPDQVIVVSMAATTAEMTGRKVKADTWGSVESVLARIDRGNLRVNPESLVVIEEVGQLSTLQADRLLKAVGNARIVTLGDHKQLSAIGAAGWYTDALSRHGSVELSEVRRQVDEQDVKAYDLVRHGKAPEALKDLAERGRVHMAATDAERVVAMLDKYSELRNAGTPARHVRMTLDGSNVDVDTCNRFVQRDRLARREIAQRFVEVDNGERRWRLHENDQVITLAAIRVRGEDPVKNGKAATVRRIYDDGSVRLRLDDGAREFTVKASGEIGLAYALHIQKYQGDEVEFALCAPGRGTSQNSTYTMLSRGKIESHVFGSLETHQSVEHMGEMIQRVEEKESAHTTRARLRAQDGPVREQLPPSRSDEIQLHDINLDPIPSLDPVRIERDPLEQVLIEQSLDQPLDSDLGLGREM